MATTAGGLPYVESSDLISGYPTVSQALAEELDTQLANKVNIVSTDTLRFGAAAGRDYLGLGSYYGAANGGGYAFVSMADDQGGMLLRNDAGNAFQLLTAPANGAAGSALTVTERLRMALDGTITGSGPSLGAWSSYDPVVSGTGWALGNGTVIGRYARLGKRVLFTAMVTFGSTSTFGSDVLKISLPLAKYATNSEFHFAGEAINIDLGHTYHVHIKTNGNDALIYALRDGTGYSEAAISTKPFTWASGDNIRLSGAYETSA